MAAAMQQQCDGGWCVMRSGRILPYPLKAALKDSPQVWVWRCLDQKDEIERRDWMAVVDFGGRSQKSQNL
eukprot:scaffold3022_cov42-Cyclotella_meneghiniana.AAC.7